LRRVFQIHARAGLQRDLQYAAHQGIAGGVLVRSAGQRHGAIQEIAPEGDHLLAALDIVALARRQFARLGDRVGAVKRVIKTAPAGIGGVEGEARIAERHNQLRPRYDRDLRIGIARADLKILAFGLEISDLFQEGGIGFGVDGARRMRPVPIVDCRLQPVALGKQRLVLRRQPMRQLRESGPERGGVQARIGQRFTRYEVVKGWVYPKPVLLDHVCHGLFRGCGPILMSRF
jgi:hypothetical protein